MSKTRLPLAVALFAIGIVWLGQGFGFIGGSFMTGEPVWAAVGGVFVVVGVVLFIADRRSK